MFFTKEELLIAWGALVQEGDKQRTFSISDLKCASNAAVKLKECTKDDAFTEDAEAEFSTDEKKLLLDCLRDREWNAAQGEFVLSLEEKLS